MRAAAPGRSGPRPGACPEGAALRYRASTAPGPGRVAVGGGALMVRAVLARGAADMRRARFRPPPQARPFRPAVSGARRAAPAHPPAAPGLRSAPEGNRYAASSSGLAW